MISPFILFNPLKARRFVRRFEFFGKLLLRVVPFIEEDLEVLDPRIKAHVYLSSAFLSAFVYALFFPLLLFIATWGAKELWFVELAVFLYMFFFILVINIVYPRAKVQDMSKKIDRDLSFILNDMLIQLRSGVLLYDALIITSTSNYGMASKKLKRVVSRINEGYSDAEALGELARTIRSNFMRKTLWQLSTAMRVGGDVTDVLESIDKTVKEYNERELKRYLEKVNLLLFGYLLLGAVVPAIFLVTGVIVSAIMDIEFSELLIAVVLVSSLLVQAFLVGFIRTSKPAVIE
ncbi:MAG: type II secretion system F family protein [Methanobacteriota archaeon]|nr:MAG: type II secretion system F family protein [Euryarchaeota archaeon]